ncbi:hypothetical protein BDN70DRAFT_275395 [Pholiota conissans]|uniref:F-box domain-containing protein n=1 Tax=Pholiota conissans TaxID=109636 RepID=A0A9P5YTY8_9AGAR|nr:hypothetical protein BDN70DRAFT_275395 [Pholiota conissans]
MDTIPNELLSEILDQLGDDREALRACARVSQWMCAAAQRRLFRRISLVLQGAVPLEIGAAFGLGRPEWFLELVQSPSSTSASLADYVVHLEVHQMSRFPAREGVEAFRALLPMLRNVVEVSFPPVVNSFESYDRCGDNPLFSSQSSIVDFIDVKFILSLYVGTTRSFGQARMACRRWCLI